MVLPGSMYSNADSDKDLTLFEEWNFSRAPTVQGNASATVTVVIPFTIGVALLTT